MTDTDRSRAIERGIWLHTPPVSEVSVAIVRGSKAQALVAKLRERGFPVQSYLGRVPPDCAIVIASSKIGGAVAAGCARPLPDDASGDAGLAESMAEELRTSMRNRGGEGC